MLLRVIDCYYTVGTEGYRQRTPIIHLFGRDQSWERHHVPIEGFRPYFVVTQDQYVQYGEALADDERVIDVTAEDMQGRTETTLTGEMAYRVVCREPGDVADLRDVFDELPAEADVRFPVRFLIDMDIEQWADVPDTGGSMEHPVHVSDVSAVDDPPEQTPPIRLCTYDIEVQQGGSGPPVVSEQGCEQTRNPITAITAHDSYTDEYHVWLLAHSSWDAEDSQAARKAVSDKATVSVYGSARDVAAKFCRFIQERDFDACIGWNAAGFDHPYFINFCLNNNVTSVYGLSPTGDVHHMNGDGNWINSSLKGRVLLDLLEMYKKCNVHKLDSYRLEDVTDEEEVSVGKLSITDEIDVPEGKSPIDWSWRHYPSVFSTYSLRDVEAAVAINRESQKEVNIL